MGTNDARAMVTPRVSDETIGQHVCCEHLSHAVVRHWFLPLLTS